MDAEFFGKLRSLRCCRLLRCDFVTSLLSCEGKLTLQNCWDVLSSMKSGKTPGSAGFTKEFYVCFFGEVTPFLSNSLNYSFKVGKLSTSQKQAVIILIEKKGRDKRLVKTGDLFHS